MRIVFHGENAASFESGFAELVGDDAQIFKLPDALTTEADRACYAAADVVIGIRYNDTFPKFERLSLYHVPGAGYDQVILNALPDETVVCNCFGHEPAIAEYVMSALLARHVPLADADARLRRNDWKYWASAAQNVHDEMSGKTIGLLGFGHIAQAIAARAKAFDLQVHVANRGAVATSAIVDRYFALDDLKEFWPTADFIVVTVPLTEQTTGLVGAEAFAAMRPDAVIINVGRGPTIDEKALFDALSTGRIGGAIIDTWYQYPSTTQPATAPSKLPFNTLPNIVMTPHMSGWTSGTIRRRQQTIADNIAKRMAGLPCDNVVRGQQGSDA
jgi:phosphoglycerate dehydrogenase-like enzyme